MLLIFLADLWLVLALLVWGAIFLFFRFQVYTFVIACSYGVAVIS